MPSVGKRSTDFASAFRGAQRQSGFTLIEVMLVLVVVGVLVGVTLPIVQRSIRKAKHADAVQELVSITMAIERFKAQYGIYPPSRIRLREDVSYSLIDDFDQHSVKYLQRIWPQIELPLSPKQPAPIRRTDPSQWIWFAESSVNGGDGVQQTYELEGDECLVFFLGGIAQNLSPSDSPAGPFVLHGFSNRATDPSGLPNSDVPETTARIGPIYQFDVKRLFVRNGYVYPGTVANAAWPNEDFMSAVQPRPPKLPSYRAQESNPTEPRPIAYFSAYEGRGYRPHDVNFNPDGGGLAEPISPGTFQVTWPPIPKALFANRQAIYASYSSPAPNPYTESLPDPFSEIDWSGRRQIPSSSTVRYFNPNSFQVIFPGRDNQYGPGGQLPREPTAVAINGKGDMIGGGVSFDNLTNISGSALLGDFNKARLEELGQVRQ